MAHCARVDWNWGECRDGGECGEGGDEGRLGVRTGIRAERRMQRDGGDVAVAHTMYSELLVVNKSKQQEEGAAAASRMVCTGA